MSDFRSKFSDLKDKVFHVLDQAILQGVHNVYKILNIRLQKCNVIRDIRLKKCNNILNIRL